MSNIYFFILMCMQMVDEISITNGKAAMMPPLIFVVVVSMIKDAYEDVLRHLEDKKENNEITRKFDRSREEFIKCRWQDVKIGDIVRIKEDEFFPADILTLSTTEVEGVCYVETKNLDGETNLKNKNALAATNDRFPDEKGLKDLQGVIEVECPNNRIYKFDGNFRINTDTLNSNKDLSIQELADEVE